MLVMLGGNVSNLSSSKGGKNKWFNLVGIIQLLSIWVNIVFFQ